MNNTTPSKNKSTITKTSFSSNDFNNLLKKRDITQSLSPKQDILDKLNSRPTLPSSHPAKIRNDLLSRTKTASTINSSIQSRFNKRANELLTLRSDAIHRLNKLNNLKSSYQSKLIGLNNNKAFSNFNKVMKPISLGLKYYEENKEEIDKTLELFESYAKKYPVEAEEMSIIDFLDFVDEKEAQERFVEAFKTVFISAPAYTVPTSYQLIEQFNGSISNQLSQLNYFIELSLSSNDLINLRLITLLIFEHFADNYVNDKSGYPHTSLIIHIILLLSFGNLNNKDTDK